MARIAIGGFQHETNTFAPAKAGYAAFEAGGGWPGVQYGEPIFAAVDGANIPAAGAIGALRSMGHTLVGTAWAAASPSAHVTDEAFERIAGGMIANLRNALPLDGVYLDLHGAMVCESHDDGEGELLRRVREVVGARVPLVASLDLHANVTRAMIERADALVAYRTYPHVDMADTGARAARLLDQMLRSGSRLAGAFQPLDYLTGIPSQCSFIEPCRSIYRELEQPGGAARRDAVVRARFPDGRLRRVRHVGVRLWRGAEGRRRRGRGAAPRWWPTRRRISRSSCIPRATPWRARAAAASPARRWCLPTRRTTRAPAATATPPAC